MWQSQVEIEHSSVVYFNRVTALEVLAIAQNFHGEWGSYTLCRCTNT